MGEDFTYQFTIEGHGLTEELLESLRIWPQTRICYAHMKDGSLRVLAIEIKMHQSASPPACDEFAWSIPVKWKCKNEVDG